MFRNGVSTTSPEGSKWQPIPSPSGVEILQICVGSTGMVWASTSSGRALVRSGVTRDSLSGKTWLEVSPPVSGSKIIQIGVGYNSVWCVTNDNHVWFRRGVSGSTAGISEESAVGSGWVEMIGNISHISVAQNDQVFAIGSEDRALYFRSGVSDADLTGKKWKLIQSQMQMSRNSSNMSLCSRRSSTGSDATRVRSLSNLKYHQQESVCSIQEDDDEQSRSAPVNNLKKPTMWEKPLDNQTPPQKDPQEFIANSCPVKNEVYEVAGRQMKGHAWSPIRSAGSVVAVEANPEESGVFEASSNRDSGVFGEDDFVGSQYIECDITWINITAGAVTVDPNQLPRWFSESSDDNRAELNKPWRNKILEGLKLRNETFSSEEFHGYEQAVETSSWVKSGEVRIARINGGFEDCLIELEWVSSTTGMDSGTFTVLNSDGVSTKIQFSLSDINCVMTCSELGHPRLAIHVSRLPLGFSPLKLQFSGDSDMEDWLSHLTSVTCQINEVRDRPSNDSIWITSQLGEVFVFDPTNLRIQQKNNSNMYTKEIDVSAAETPYLAQLANGMPLGTVLKITGCVYDDADSIRFDLQAHATVRMKHKSEYFRNMPLHLNPRFHERCIVLNSMEMSNWETEYRDKRMVFTPGKEFKLEIRSEQSGYRIFVDGNDFLFWRHRGQKPEAVVSLHCSGRVKLFKIVYETPKLIFSIEDLFWRQIGGHLRKVVTCKAGVIWGIGFDHQLWHYTGAFGGFMKGMFDFHSETIKI